VVHNTPGVALLASLPLVLGRIEADIGRCRLLVGAAHAPVRHEYVQATDRVVRTGAANESVGSLRETCRPATALM